MEWLDRGVVAVARDDGAVVLGWRLLGNEPPSLGFNVYRSAEGGATTRLNDAPLTGPTQFVDAKPDAKAATYIVRPVAADGTELPEGGGTATASDRPYLMIPLKTPEGYAPNDASAADLDGDGRYELILMQVRGGQDNSRPGVTPPVFIQAYTLDGKMLWQIDLGPNIRAGAHYTQFMVADFDGDGRAEMICKTSDGTVDGAGKNIGDAAAKHFNEQGHILKGPEWLTVFDGQSGAAIDTILYTPGRAGPDRPGDNEPASDDMKAVWGDGYGNRGERYLAAVAWLDGVRPTAVMCRGYYTRSFLWAVDFDGSKLQQRWLFDSENPEQTNNGEITAPSSITPRGNRGGDRPRPNPYSGQGFHSLSVADVDGDGTDEIVYGAMTLDDDGTGRYVTGWGHGDAIHVGDLDLDNPGLEVFGIQERFDDAGAHMHDARTGKPLWKKPSVRAADAGGDRGEGPGRGVCFDVDPRTPGSESWTAGAGIEGVWDAKGNEIGTAKPASCNFRIYWDGDLLDELLDKNHVSKWNWETQKTDRLFTAEGCESNNGTKANPALSADLFGDWREEVVFRTSDNQALRVYTTTIPTEHRRFTLMHDPQYRASVAWQNVAYNQPPHVGVNMHDLAKGPPPTPNIELVKAAAATAARK